MSDDTHGGECTMRIIQTAEKKSSRRCVITRQPVHLDKILDGYNYCCYEMNVLCALRPSAQVSFSLARFPYRCRNNECVTCRYASSMSCFPITFFRRAEPSSYTGGHVSVTNPHVRHPPHACHRPTHPGSAHLPLFALFIQTLRNTGYTPTEQ